MIQQERIAVIGLGYVGLPVALAFAKAFPGVIGFDIDAERVAELKACHDRTGEAEDGELEVTNLHLTADPADLADATFYIVTVPTPIDANRRPDLGSLQAACRTVGLYLTPDAVVVFESTVYPGVTEDICGPILADQSGLRQGEDFKLAYSPERINPGDRRHTLENIVKVVSGEDAETLNRVASVYEWIISAGVHRAPSIRVAEAAKVIENTQRDLNIALMNELALIFDRIGLPTRDVLAAAGSKWNFLPFQPGLVGGHCIGVDPYYLTACAEAAGFHPEVILSGRRVNDAMGRFVARSLIKLLPAAGLKSRVGILGLTFKEDVPDLRNSRVPDIVTELQAFGSEVLIHDPYADPVEARTEYGLQLAKWEDMKDLDGCVLAVAHRAYRDAGSDAIRAMLKPGGALADVKSILDPADFADDYRYWSL